jgi:O-antigen ligase
MHNLDNAGNQKAGAILVALFVAAIATLFLSPGGKLGLLLPTLLLAVALALCNMETVSAYLLLGAGPVVGTLAAAGAMPGVGGKVILPLGCLLCVLCLRRRGVAFLPGKGGAVLWLMLAITLICLSYSWGPMTDNSRAKLQSMMVSLFSYVLSFLVLYCCEKADTFRLGTLLVLSAAAVYIYSLVLVPGLRPASVLSPAGIRELSGNLTGEDFGLGVLQGAQQAATGLVFILSALTSARRSKTMLAVALLASLTALLMLNSYGQRTFILAPTIVMLAFMCITKNISKWFLVFGVGALCAVVFFQLEYGQEGAEMLSGGNLTMAERMNRSANWDAAIVRISERPLFGHGLGGYYIDGFSLPGDGTYPHNLLLELLSETGVIITFLVLAPPLAVMWTLRRHLLSLRYACGCYHLPVLLLMLLIRMSVGNLSASMSFIALAGVAWGISSGSIVVDNMGDRKERSERAGGAEERYVLINTEGET